MCRLGTGGAWEVEKGRKVKEKDGGQRQAGGEVAPLDVVRDRQQSECKQAEARSKIDRRPSQWQQPLPRMELSIYQQARLTVRTPQCCAEHARDTHRAGGLSPECVSMLPYRRTEVRPGHWSRAGRSGLVPFHPAFSPAR